MKFIIFLSFLLVATNASALQVFYKKDSKEVVLIAKDDEVVMNNEGLERVVIDDNINLSQPIEYYLYENNTLIVNTDKISSEVRDAKKAEKRAKELQRIERKKNKMAYEALKSEGVVFKEIVDEEFNE